MSDIGKNIVNQLQRSGVKLTLTDGSVSVDSKSIRILTEEESLAVETNKSSIIEYLESLPTTSELGVAPKTISNKFRGATSDVSPPNMRGSTASLGVYSINGLTGGVTFDYVSSVCGNTGDVSVVCTFNGSTGAVEGVSSVNGSTGAVEGVSSVNGSTGAVTLTDLVGVNTWNGLSGDVDVTTSVMEVGGISSGGGATFSGIVGITGSGNYLQFPDGTTQGAAASTYVDEIIGINIDNGTSVLTTGVKGHRVLPYDCEIVGWTLTSNDTGSIDWEINWCTYTNWPTTASTHAHHSYSPAFTSTNKATATSITPSEWTTYQFSEGDILEFEIKSVTTCTDCNFAVRIRRTS